MRATILTLVLVSIATGVSAQQAPSDTGGEASPASEAAPAVGDTVGDDEGAVRVVHRIVVDGAISPASAEYIADAITRAEQAGAGALVIELDTPGGLVESTRDIVQSMLASSVPVVVYVAPGGARAGSAGVFLTLAAHVAAMAPGTNIGAATPITMGGDETMPGGGGRPSPPDSVEQTRPEATGALDQKILNDTIAFIRSIAEKRGRNADWAERAVTEAASITETQAVEQNVVDLVARSTGELLEAIDGREVEVLEGTVALETAGAEVVTQEKSLRFKILDTIANPNIAFILMMIGIWGVFFELMNPGAILPGVVGGISLLLAFFALQALPVNYVGVMLILFSLVLFIAEVKVISHGLLTVGGTIAFVLGATMLFEGPGSLFAVSWSVIVPVAILTVAFFVFAMRLAYKTWKSQPTTGREGLVGERGVVRRRIDPVGKVAVHGEIWTARATEPIEAGAPVEVIASEGLTVDVRPVDELTAEARRAD